jgi:carboxymethylenebutenolidase
MPRKTAADFSPEVLRLFDQYVHGLITRRGFLDGASRYAVGGKARPDVNGRVGAVGFCFGGGMVNFLATQWPDLAAGVAFYGMAPPLEDVPKIKAPLLLHFAQNDERIDAAWPAYEAALKKAGVHFEAFIYPGTEHGFNNDTTPRYDAKAAALAWSRTLDFFRAHLK